MSTKQVITSAYKPRPEAIPFHARHQRFSVLVWHRRAGKTVACINDIVDKAIQCPLMFPQYAYIAPFYSQAKSIAWNYLKYYAGELIEKTMESELSVILKNGARVRLYGADNPDALRGNYFDGVIIDEYGDISPRLFGEIIAPALADRKGWCAFIGTPKGPNHFKKLWDDAIENKGWFMSMLKASQSGIIDAEELAMLRNSPGSDENTFRQEFECDFTAAVRGAYYGDQINELEATHCGVFPHNPNKSVILGFDIGYSDDTSIWFAQVNGREIAIIDFFSVAGYSVDDVLGYLSSLPYSYGDFHLPHDAKNKSFQTGKSVRELMMAAGCKTKIVPSLSVQDGIQAVRKTLPDVYFNTANDRVREGLNALRTYQREWDDKNKIFKEKPKHDWSSNPADAFRMLCLALNPFAAKKASAIIRTEKVISPLHAMNLENLFADREKRTNNPRV